MPISLPTAHSEFTKDGRPTKPFYDLLRALVAAYNASPTTESLAAITERLTALESAGVDFTGHGVNGITITGDGAGGWVFTLDASTDNVPEGLANLYWTAPTGSGLVGVTSGVKDAAAVTIGSGLSLAAGVLSTSGGGAGALTLVGTATVSGAAATTLTMSGLDLGADNRYLIQVALQNATGSTSEVRLLYNGDTTLTNYWEQEHSMQNGTQAGARANSALAFYMYGSEYSNARIDMWKGTDSKTRAFTDSIENVASTIVMRATRHIWTSATNVTSISLQTSVASALAIGSKFTVWKMT